MATNILESMMTSFGSEFSRLASGYLNASETMTKAAMGTVFPSLLGAVVQQGSTPAGASSLLNAINSPSIGTDIASSMTKMFSGGPAAENLMTLGSNMVKGLFGDRFSNVAETAAKASGLGTAAIEKMFAMGAPLLFGFLKNQVAVGKLDSSGLTKLLESQRDFVKAGIDSSLAGVLGLGGIGGLFAGVTGAMEKAFGAIAEAGTTAIEEATKMAEKMAGLTGEAARAAGESATKATATATDASTNAISSIVKTAETMAVHSAEAAKSIGEIASKAAHAASEMGTNAFKSAGSAATKVSDAAKTAATAAAEAASTSVDAGTNAVTGAIKGAEHLADAAVDATKKATGAAKDVVADATKKKDA
ncbi:MAG TPA: DUF937 domain-containing protein [Burkholderiales bacterium]|nr:DUF937 domain-containing protein [Burkholderiales bacterium]